MSAFLGPIHVKMYQRILYQDTMSQAFLELAAKHGWDSGLETHVNSQAPAAPGQPLETIIDQSNIHGWLSNAVMHCEQRFALIVCRILADNPKHMDDLQNLMKAMGEACRLPSGIDAEQAFQSIHDILLDGMPCDFPFTITSSGSDEVTWQVTNCPHTPYWKDSMCKAETYYQLRDAWMDGALSQSGIVHRRPEPYTHIMRKDNHHE